MEIFAIDQNYCDVFKVNTAKIFFEFEPFSINPPKKTVFVKNISDDPQSLFLKNPLTVYFKAECQLLRGMMLPQKSLEIDIMCKGNLENRPYYDRMIIKCSKGCGLMIKICASPTNNILNIPSEINLGSVQLGETSKAVITLPPLRDGMPFTIIPSTCNPELTIKPLKGIIVKKPVDIEISYTPKAYVTVCFPVHVYLPSVTVLPYYLTITADTKPGYLGELIAGAKPIMHEESSIPKVPKCKFPKLTPKVIHCKEKHSEWTQHHINKFLMKKDENTEIEELIGPLGRTIMSEEVVKKTKQNEFLSKVECIKKKEEDSLLHKKDFTFEPESLDETKWDLLWQKHQEDKIGFKENRLPKPVLQSQRPIISMSEDPIPKFTDKPVNLWLLRYHAYYRFVDVARTIVVQNRLLKRLETLKTKVGKDKMVQHLARS